MKSRSAALAILSPLIRQLPRRSSESQPKTDGTFGHLARLRATASSTEGRLARELVDRLRLHDAEALRVAHAERLQPGEDVLLLDAFGDDAEVDRLADLEDGIHLGAGNLARGDLAHDGAVDLHEVGADRLERRERHRLVAETVDEHAASHHLHGGDEALDRLRA